MIKTKGLAHFTIPVSDTVRSEKFYTEVLGMKSIRSNHKRGMVFLDTGGDCVILVRVDDPISTAKVRDVHHAFMVDHDEYESAVKQRKLLVKHLTGAGGAADAEAAGGGGAAGPRS